MTKSVRRLAHSEVRGAADMSHVTRWGWAPAHLDRRALNPQPAGRSAGSLAYREMPATHQPRAGRWRRTSASASSARSCSQMRTTVQPISSSRAVVSRSRSTFAFSFDSHHAAFRTGQVACWGQPCQKQPSMKTAILCLENTMSAVRRGTPGRGALTRYRYPSRCRALLSATSGPVSRVRCRDILRDVAGSVDGGVTSRPATGLSVGTGPIIVRVESERAYDRLYNSADTVGSCERGLRR